MLRGAEDKEKKREEKKEKKEKEEEKKKKRRKNQKEIRTERSVSYTHLRAHETPEHLVCRLLLEKKQPTHTHETLYFLLHNHNT